MADDEDQASKTEDPTERKLRKLREEGNVPKSREVNNLFMLGAMLLALVLAVPWQMKQLMDLFGGTLQVIGTTPVGEAQTIAPVMRTMFIEGMKAIAPVFLILIIAAYVGAFVQTGSIFSIKPIEPKLSKISFIKGFKRIFSLKGLAEFFKTLFKFAILTWAIWLIFKYNGDVLLMLSDMDLMAIIITTKTIAIIKTIAITTA